MKVWVEVDGMRAPVSSEEDPERGDFGHAVLCNRASRIRVTDLDDEDATFEQFLRTRSTNAFQWVALDVGQVSPRSVHTIAVRAQLEAQVTGVGDAKAAVGKRTLVVEPVKLANDITV